MWQSLGRKIHFQFYLSSLKSLSLFLLLECAPTSNQTVIQATGTFSSILLRASLLLSHFFSFSAQAGCPGHPELFCVPASANPPASPGPRGESGGQQGKHGWRERADGSLSLLTFNLLNSVLSYCRSFLGCFDVAGIAVQKARESQGNSSYFSFNLQAKFLKDLQRSVSDFHSKLCTGK